MEFYNFSIFPCNGPNSKNPKVPVSGWGVTKATSDPGIIKNISSRYTSFAIACGDHKEGQNGLVAIDIDIKNNERGFESFERLRKEFNVDLPVTWMQETPSGGLHYLFEVPRGISINQKACKKNGFSGIDLKHTNGYICTGDGYTVVSDIKPVEIPENLLKALIDLTLRMKEKSELVEKLDNVAQHATIKRGGSNQKYVETVINNALAEIEMTGEGNRNNIVHKVALSFAGFIQDGYITEQEIVSLVGNAAKKIHKASEMNGIYKTIKSGIKLGGVRVWRPWEKTDNASKAFDSHNMGIKYSKLEPENEENIEWEEPIPLDNFEPPDFPTDLFSEDVQRYVNELSASTETPIELASMCALSVLSAACQGKFKVKVKDDYREPLSIWACMLLESATRKTEIINKMSAPLTEKQTELREIMKPIIFRAKIKRSAFDTKLKKMNKGAEKLEGVKFEDAADKIADFAETAPQVPTLPQLVCGDVTPEKLADVMKKNGGISSIFVDEGGLFTTIGGRYSNGTPNLDIFLKAHACSSVIVNRMTRDDIAIAQPGLTIAMGIQPGVFRKTTENPIFKDSGLLARFLYVQPKTTVGNRTFDKETVKQTTTNGYKDVIFNMLKMDNNQDDISLDEEAYKLYYEFCLYVEKNLKPNGFFKYIKAWGGKLAGAVIRIAGILHVEKYAHRDPRIPKIDAEIMRKAINLGRVLANHALEVLCSLNDDSHIEDAKIILHWIANLKKDRFTFSECRNAHRSRFKTTKKMEPVIELLIELREIKEISAKTSSRIFMINELGC